MERTCWEDLDFQYQEPSSEYIEEELAKIEEQLREFCALIEIKFEKLRVNAKTLKDIIIRLDMRGLYFHIYHKKMEANEYKRNIGLLVFWILKLRPFWIDIQQEDSDEQIELATYINEKICLHIILSLLREYNSNFFEYGKDLVKAYVNELEYSLRYRDLSKESMFLLFDPFYYLYFYNQSTQEDGTTII